ncbi:unnamed protein product, partial [Pylaiella littoralis]
NGWQLKVKKQATLSDGKERRRPARCGPDVTGAAFLASLPALAPGLQQAVFPKDLERTLLVDTLCERFATSCLSSQPTHARASVPRATETKPSLPDPKATPARFPREVIQEEDLSEIFPTDGQDWGRCP